MEKEKVDKKDHILDVAERVFAEQGYDGASTRMISGEAGVNMAMLNYYFGSKEGVFLAIFERRISAFQSTLVDINKDDSLSPWEKLAQFIDNYLNKVINNNCFHIMLNREVSKSKKTDLTDKITSIIMRNVVVFQDIIDDGIRKGAFNKDADKELLVATMFGTKNYIVNTPHISSAVLGYDVMDLKTQEDIIKPRLKNYMKTLFKAYLTHENDNK